MPCALPCQFLSYLDSKPYGAVIDMEAVILSLNLWAAKKLGTYELTAQSATVPSFPLYASVGKTAAPLIEITVFLSPLFKKDKAEGLANAAVASLFAFVTAPDIAVPILDAPCSCI